MRKTMTFNIQDTSLFDPDDYDKKLKRKLLEQCYEGAVKKVFESQTRSVKKNALGQ